MKQFKVTHEKASPTTVYAPSPLKAVELIAASVGYDGLYRAETRGKNAWEQPKNFRVTLTSQELVVAPAEDVPPPSNAVELLSKIVRDHD